MDDELAAFCDREHGRLLAALTLVCGDVHLAEELTQDALATACRTWGETRQLEAPGAYVHRVAMNAASSFFRRKLAERRALRRVATGTAQAYRDPDGADTVAVREAMRTIDPKHRRVLVARYYLGYDVAGTAHLLDLPVGTVKTYSARGIAALREAMGVDVKEPQP